MNKLLASTAILLCLTQPAKALTLSAGLGSLTGNIGTIPVLNLEFLGDGDRAGMGMHTNFVSYAVAYAVVDTFEGKWGMPITVGLGWAAVKGVGETLPAIAFEVGIGVSRHFNQTYVSLRGIVGGAFVRDIDIEALPYGGASFLLGYRF